MSAPNWQTYILQVKLRGAAPRTEKQGGTSVAEAKELLRSRLRDVDKERLIDIVQLSVLGDPWNNGQPLDPLDNLHPRQGEAS